MKSSLAALRFKAINTAHQVLPRPIWNAAMLALGKPTFPPLQKFGPMQTWANVEPLMLGRFADLYAKNVKLDPFLAHAPNEIRYKTYNVCRFAELCMHLPGDFVSAGISYGVSQHLVYDFVDIPALGKTLHLIDPFAGSGPGRKGYAHEGYNHDPDVVLRQYPKDAPIKIHRATIPEALPLPGVDKIAFFFDDTGHPAASAASLPILWPQLSVGGIYMTGQYGSGLDHFKEPIKLLGVDPIWLASGQGVFIKR